MNHESAELGRKQTQKGKDRRADNMKRCILIVLCASVLILDGFAVVHGYSGTVDQQWAPSFAGAGWNWVYAHQPILQTFTPTLPSLAGVDVGLENTGTGPEMITVQIGHAAWTVAEVSIQIPVPPGGPTWLHVDCSAPVSPGQMYAVRLLVDSSSAHDVRAVV
jgi:hypothetical protein